MKPRSPSLTFEERRDGRIAALLGAREVGMIFPVAHDDERYPHLKIAFTFELGPHAGPILVRSNRAAKIRMRRYAERWMGARGMMLA